MSLLSKLKYGWHYLRRNYHKELIESCLDHELRAKLKNKLDYHNIKLEELCGKKAS
ncbi:hypothetical protein [Bacillus sp. SA1-12]|uniref:hypothetical protein n=1 Tax=Bacillus sp. SA1-12 TaxID=1455638 RepID=UPI000A906527|nr:hypothetical protein [Bacillus sp. SA1-12]